MTIRITFDSVGVEICYGLRYNYGYTPDGADDLKNYLDNGFFPQHTWRFYKVIRYDVLKKYGLLNYLEEPAM